MRKCLLIGGTGFIGQNLAIRFCKEYKVDIWDVSINTNLKNNNISIVYFDYYNGQINPEDLNDYEFIVLLTCSVGPSTSMVDTELCYDKDILSMIKLLNSMVKSACKKLIFISSGGTVYGNHKMDLLDENTPTNPLNHYGIMKLAQEKMLLMYNELYSMNNFIFRVSNPYGMGQRMSSGIGAVTNFLEKVLNNKTIQIWGDGENVRDYIWIGDVSEVIYKIIHNDKNIEVPIINIGTGIGTSLNELVNIIEKITGKTALVEYTPSRDVDVIRNVLNNQKLKTIIGDYEFKSLEQGIRDYIKELK